MPAFFVGTGLICSASRGSRKSAIADQDAGTEDEAAADDHL